MPNVKRETLDPEFIAGLIVGEGTFYWTTCPLGKIPAFALRMHVRDKELVSKVRDALGLRNKVYEYTHNNRHYVFLIVREIGALKNNIISAFYPRLKGYKRLQFLEWFHGFFDAETAEGYQFFPNALRRQFPELCDEQTLTQMISEERAQLQGEATLKSATTAARLPIEIWPWERGA